MSPTDGAYCTKNDTHFPPYYTQQYHHLLTIQRPCCPNICNNNKMTQCSLDNWKVTHSTEYTALTCWILILFFLIRMLSLQLYTCIQPSSVPNHIVDCCSSDCTSSERFIVVVTRFSCSSFSESLELLESSMLSEHFSDFFRFALEQADNCRVVVSSIDMLTKLVEVELKKFGFVLHDSINNSSDIYDSTFAGMEVTHNIRALHTPLQDTTVGSGNRLSTHTWPT